MIRDYGKMFANSRIHESIVVYIKNMFIVTYVHLYLFGHIFLYTFVQIPGLYRPYVCGIYRPYVRGIYFRRNTYFFKLKTHGVLQL